LKGNAAGLLLFQLIFMKNFLLIAIAAIYFASCNNSADTKTFCDTTCVKDSIAINGDAGTDQSLGIKINNCKPDTISWSNKNITRRIAFNEYINKDVRMNPSFVKAAFQESCAWLSFNDCITGRGYLMRLPYSGAEPIDKMTAALNSFDKKFSVEDDLRAYTDGGNIYVVNVKTGQKAEMTFKEDYKMDYDNIHSALDSINVTKSRIYVKLLKEGKEVALEKNISL
jgi:hypothetical protein